MVATMKTLSADAQGAVRALASGPVRVTRFNRYSVAELIAVGAIELEENFIALSELGRNIVKQAYADSRDSVLVHAPKLD